MELVMRSDLLYVLLGSAVGHNTQCQEFYSAVTGRKAAYT